jgi:hypothetical protein
MRGNGYRISEKRLDDPVTDIQRRTRQNAAIHQYVVTGFSNQLTARRRRISETVNRNDNMSKVGCAVREPPGNKQVPRIEKSKNSVLL